MTLAAPGSVAAAYAQYNVDANQAAIDGGSDYDDETLSEIDGGYKSCSGGTSDDDCVTWTDFESSDGKISSLKVNETDISKRISIGNGRSKKAGDLATVELLTAYQSVQANDMVVNALIKSGDGEITIGTYEAKYRGPDGRQTTASAAEGPTELDADSTANVTLSFKNAKPSGEVTITVYNEDYDEETVTLKTR